MLVGPNNSGKTSIIEALALVLGRDRLVRDLTEHDFYGSNQQAADRIKVITTITGFASEDFTALPDWFRDGRGVPVWFDPETGDVVPEKTHDNQTLACQVAFSATSTARVSRLKQLGTSMMTMARTFSRKNALFPSPSILFARLGSAGRNIVACGVESCPA